LLGVDNSLQEGVIVMGLWFLRSVPISAKDGRIIMREAKTIFGENDTKRLTKKEREESRRELAWLKRELRALIRRSALE